MKSITIYVNDNDNIWLKELHKYAKNNKWSVSLAIRELLRAYFENDTKLSEAITEGYKETAEAMGNLIKRHMEEVPPKLSGAPVEKIDIATFEAQIEQQIIPKVDNTDIDKQVDNCVREHTNNYEISCYHFDNARDYKPFCKQYCWTNKNIWKERVRL